MGNDTSDTNERKIGSRPSQPETRGRAALTGSRLPLPKLRGGAARSPSRSSRISARIRRSFRTGKRYAARAVTVQSELAARSRSAAPRGCPKRLLAFHPGLSWLSPEACRAILGTGHTSPGGVCARPLSRSSAHTASGVAQANWPERVLKEPEQ